MRPFARLRAWITAASSSRTAIVPCFCRLYLLGRANLFLRTVQPSLQLHSGDLVGKDQATVDSGEVGRLWKSIVIRRTMFSLQQRYRSNKACVHHSHVGRYRYLTYAMMMADRSGSHIRAQQACKQGSTADHGWYGLVAAPDVHRLRIHTQSLSLSLRCWWLVAGWQRCLRPASIVKRVWQGWNVKTSSQVQ